ncbi:hypothetical protein MIT9_P1196 [Methylomarinovum caldicuralii]|uniref:Uncharacterized protein n=1 Tax=Methylomarinovum caldicuralii TaxID=438856 RepID=A0AAU9BS01_9GAMM|nr:hypothetical protein [Methylomarinovum caldicuralii]BCX81618.1 hypothetical protein MIT9_P1196 [Methylomarinovum caldicuralii]
MKTFVMRSVLALAILFWGMAGAETLVPDAVYGQTDSGIEYVTIPVTDCANLTATPIVVGDWLVYPMHEHSSNCSGPGPYRHTLFGYRLSDGRLYQLRDDGAGEAPLNYWQDQDLLLWNTTFGGTVFLLDPGTFDLRRKLSVQTTSDSGGVVLDGLYYFCTINSPDHTCQNPTNPNCGALFAIDAEGNVVHSLNLDGGFLAWIGTSPTSDGQYLYWSTAAQTVGEKSGDETTYTYGCSVVKTDKELNVLASFDPGDPACYMLPFTGANMDSVSGEVVPDGTGLWVQYVRPNEAAGAGGQFKSVLYRLDLNLQEQCRLTFDFEPQTQAAGFYAAPTVDADGNAYVPVSVPDADHTRRGQLWKVTPACEATLLAEVPGSFAHASPTLADDRYVLFATDGRLQVLTLTGEQVRDYTLASQAPVLTSPVIHEGTIYVVQEDGTLNRIEGSGVAGYGSAIWPRYRRDNRGSAALSSSKGASAQVRGAFIAFHLEVKDLPGIRSLWPRLEDFMALADRYGHKITLQFSAPWVDYVVQSGLTDKVLAWEAEGHEIALHHHGPTHKFFDGYTDAPDLIRTDAWYGNGKNVAWQGGMDALMEKLAPLTRRGILSAGMSDEDTDWPEGVLFYATDSGLEPSRDDLLSTPVVKWHNGQPVVEIYNTGYLISHLGDAAVTLSDIESALQSATEAQYMGIVFNDETISEDFAEIEPLFQLLQRYGVQVRTVSDLLGKLDGAGVREAEAVMDAGEAQYPQYFPSHETTRWFDPYLYRFYPETGVYLGINEDEKAVYLLGGVFGDTLYRVGSVSEVKALLGLD